MAIQKMGGLFPVWSIGNSPPSDGAPGVRPEDRASLDLRRLPSLSSQHPIKSQILRRLHVGRGCGVLSGGPGFQIAGERPTGAPDCILDLDKLAVAMAINNPNLSVNNDGGGV